MTGDVVIGEESRAGGPRLRFLSPYLLYRRISFRAGDEVIVPEPRGIR